MGTPPVLLSTRTAAPVQMPPMYPGAGTRAEAGVAAGPGGSWERSTQQGCPAAHPGQEALTLAALAVGA